LVYLKLFSLWQNHPELTHSAAPAECPLTTTSPYFQPYSACYLTQTSTTYARVPLRARHQDTLPWIQTVRRQGTSAEQEQGFQKDQETYWSVEVSIGL